MQRLKFFIFNFSSNLKPQDTITKQVCPLFNCCLRLSRNKHPFNTLHLCSSAYLPLANIPRPPASWELTIVPQIAPVSTPPINESCSVQNRNRSGSIFMYDEPMSCLEEQGTRDCEIFLQVISDKQWKRVRRSRNGVESYVAITCACFTGNDVRW